MSLKFEDYTYGYRIVAAAFDEQAKENVLSRELNLLYVDDGKITLYPEKIILSDKETDLASIGKYNNYDVLEIWENGFLNRRYNDKSGENYFFITGACNSNCIMCPSPEATRKNVPETNVEDLMLLAKHIPSDTPHLTITGGEPFLIGEKIFPFLRYLKDKFLATEFLFLTNGRVFSLDRYVELFVESVPCGSIVAIPVHGSSERVHDAITRVEGSFKQTKRGIKQLLKNNIRVEIRVVVSKLNQDDFDNIADLIINQFMGIEYVSVIAMEMTGNARKNKDIVWTPYKKTFSAIASGIRKLVSCGVDVKLYNFPICTVEKPFWTLCEKSISTSKVRFAETCDNCKYRAACGGVFAGTYHLEKDELKAIL